MTRLWTALFATSFVTGCVELSGDETGGGKADGNGSCAVPEYGDGTCQIDLACDVPDIDCFTPFETDALAATSLNTIWPRTIIAETDPRFVRGRALLDRSYELYKSRVQLGALADKRLSLVVLEGEVNAFVIADPATGKGSWSVHIQTALLADTFTDEQIIGMVQHELAHLSNLHFIPEVKERIRKFYVAPEGTEPIGAQQMESATALKHGAAWRKLGELIGHYSYGSLDGLPYGGELQPVFNHLRETGACPTEVAAINALYTALVPGYSYLDSSLNVPADVPAKVVPALNALETCWAPRGTLRTLLGEMHADWMPYIVEQLAQDEQMLLDLNAVTALRTVVGKRREAMRGIEAQFAKDSGQPWSRLRFFSTEEQADDAWVTVMASAKLDAVASIKGFFMQTLAAEGPACETMLGGTSVPYGQNVVDEHHGECWRIAHGRQVAMMRPASARQLEPDVETRIPRVPRKILQSPGAKPIY